MIKPWWLTWDDGTPDCWKHILTVWLAALMVPAIIVAFLYYGYWMIWIRD